MISISKEILDEIDKWAKKYNQEVVEGIDTKIQQIWYANHDMSDPRDTLFLITDKVYSSKLEDAITKFDLKITKEHKVDLHFRTWPCGYEDVKNQGFQEKIFDYVGNLL